MYCSRYKKSCDEAIYFNCNVPSNSETSEELVEECKDCVFCEVEDEQPRTLEY